MSDTPILPTAITDYWSTQPAPEKPTPQDIEWMKTTWGGALPADYRAFLNTYGFASLEDATGVPRWITFEIEEDGMTSVQEISFWTFLSRDQMQRARAWLCEDDAGSLLPPGYIAFASGGGFSYFLLKLGTEISPVYIWTEADDPWGEGDNTQISKVGETLSDFFHKLRVE